MAVRKLNNNYFNVIGDNLKKHRKSRHFSQADLTRELNLLGIPIHKNDIWLIESNKRTVKEYELWGFVNVLGISYDDMFLGIKDKLEN